MYARFHVVRQILNGLAVPLRSTAQLWFGYQLAPQNAELEANPCRSERPDIPILQQRALIDPIGFVEFTQVGEQSAKRHQILQAPGFGHPPSRREHIFESSTAGLLDGKRQAFSSGPWSAKRFGVREKIAGLGETMLHRRDLCMDERRPHGLISHTVELIHESFEAFERIHIAEKLRHELFLLDDQFRDPGLFRRSPESAP